MNMLLLFWNCLLAICVTSNENAASLKEDFSDKISESSSVCLSGDYIQTMEYARPLLPPIFFGLKNDSIFQVRIYPRSDSIRNADSLVIENIFVPMGKGNFWICHYVNGDVRIAKFKKCRHFSKEYLNANAISYWEAEMEMRANKLYDKDMILIEEVKRLGKIAIVKNMDFKNEYSQKTIIKKKKSLPFSQKKFPNASFTAPPPAALPYNSALSLWLSVDPLSDKYPGSSPYVYCANNPVRLVDVDGREIEYSSFADRLIVGILKIFDSGFRNQYKELKKSKETYVFNKNNEGTNSFTTDGNKLFINYSMADNGYSKNAGQTIFSNLRHETTHGIQFEYGELGFYFRRMGYGIVDAEGIYYEIREWQPIAYDLTDEYEAHNNQNLGFRWNGGKNDSRNQWKISDREIRMQSLRNVDSYSILPKAPFACPNDKRIKSNDTYALPHKERPHNLSYGKSFGTPPILPIRGMEYVHPIFPQSISILKADTVFCYNLYVTNNAVDSIRLAYFSVKIKGEKYIRRFDDGSYWFIKYKKIYKISSLERVIRSKSIGTVVKPRSIFRYDKDGRLTEYFFIFCGISFSRSY